MLLSQNADYTLDRVLDRGYEAGVRRVDLSGNFAEDVYQNAPKPAKRTEPTREPAA
jgi:hypothetical protein